MGCGKSTAGRAVATLLHRPFVDLDQAIEQVAGTSIAEIIGLRGEPFFRTVETQCLQQSIFDNPSIIALGGGAFTLEFNRQIISRAGTSIWIDAPFELCWQRIQEEPKIRPLAPDLATASERYELRKSVYQLAELKISVTDNETPEHLAQLIINQLQDRDTR